MIHEFMHKMAKSSVKEETLGNRKQHLAPRKRSRQIMSVVISLLMMLCLLVGCGEVLTTSNNSVGSIADMPEEQRNLKDISVWKLLFSEETDALTDFYHDYMKKGGEVALVLEVSKVEDDGYNSAIWDGIKTYANAAGVTYSYYSAKSKNDEEFYKVVETAVKNKAKLVVCAGADFTDVVIDVQSKYPDVNFLLIDADYSEDPNKAKLLKDNVHCIIFNEAQAGYLAGYMAVMEGYRKLGFMGGEEVPPVIRFGYGYLQGIDRAAKELHVEDEIAVKYKYTGTFNESKEIEAQSLEWYDAGTEVIFACGGSIVESIVKSAIKDNAWVIGVDVDQSDLSYCIITSAMKGVGQAVVTALDEYFANGKNWPKEMQGKTTEYGINEWCAGLPTDRDSWRFTKATEDQYDDIYFKLINGEETVDEQVEEFPKVGIRVSKEQ